MSRKARTTQSAIDKLVEQRRLIQDWLVKLKKNDDNMPAHVIDRVRNDYRTRLETVMAELASHRDALRDALEENHKRQEELEESMHKKKDELNELKLRRNVGEMDENEFKDQQSELTRDIEQIKKDMSATVRDIDRLEEIIELIASGEVAAPVEKPRARDPEPEEPPAAKPARPSMVAGDELDFLKSVTSVVSAAKPPAREPPAPKPEKPAPPPPPPPAKKEPPRPEPVTIDAAPGLLELPQVEETKPVVGSTPPPPNAPSPAASRVDPSVVQASLKCKECGAMNRPTEWYCAKCGAELAAV